MKKIVIPGLSTFPIDLQKNLLLLKNANVKECKNGECDLILYLGLSPDEAYDDTLLRAIGFSLREGIPCMARNVFSDGTGGIIDLQEKFTKDESKLRIINLVASDNGYSMAIKEIIAMERSFEKFDIDISFPKGTTVKDRNFFAREYGELFRFLSKKNWIYSTEFDEEEEFIKEMNTICPLSKGTVTARISKEDIKRVTISFKTLNGKNRYIYFNPKEKVAEDDYVVPNETFMKNMLEEIQVFIDK